MGDPFNPHVRIVFDDEGGKNALSNLGIDAADLFFFAYAEEVAEAGCKQIKQAVLAKTEEHFQALAPAAHAAGVLPVPLPVINYVEYKVRGGSGIFLEDCCGFSRNVQVFALGSPPADGQTPQVLQWDNRSIVVLNDDRNPDRSKRRVESLHISLRDILKDCKQI